MKFFDEFDIIMNVDETSCFSDMPSHVTLDSNIVKAVKVTTTGNGKLKFGTAMTAAVGKVDNQYEAITLPSMVLFKTLTKVPKGTFAKGLVIEVMKGETVKRVL